MINQKKKKKLFIDLVFIVWSSNLEKNKKVNK